MKYDYLEKATVAVVNSLKKTFNNYAFVANMERFQDFPVYIQTVGDEAYMTVNSDRLEAKDKSDTIMMPCMIIRINSVNINEDNKTNEISDGKFTLEIGGFKKDYTSEMSTYDVDMSLDGTILYTDIFQYMAFVEYLMNGVYKSEDFQFNYMGKVQMATWSLETVDHTLEYDDVGSFGTQSASSHRQEVNFIVKMQYPSFGLNSSLTGHVDGDGDGNNEGGIGVPVGALPTDGVIKSVIHYIDDTVITKGISKDITGGDFPEDSQKI